MKEAIITMIIAGAIVLTGCGRDRCSDANPCIQQGYICSKDRECVMADPFAMDTKQLPNAVVGEAYHFGMEASGGLTPYRWWISSDLTWLTVEASSGTLQGTPTEAVSEAIVNVSVSDNSYGDGQTKSEAFVLTVDYCSETQSNPCSGRGACEAGECSCDVGYSGDQCERCAGGFHQESGECVKDQVCLENTCSRHGTCEDSTGEVVCTCDEGYGSDFCEECSQGYQPFQDKCVAQVVDLAVGTGHTCVLLANGKARCWGYGESGQLGYGNKESIGDNETPASLLEPDVDVGGKVVDIAAGLYHTCALLEHGNVRCWGNGESGQLGYGNKENIGDNETPASLGEEADVDVGGKVVDIAAGNSHTCALLEEGNVRCWGFGAYGQLGYGNKENIGDNETPASLLEPDVDVGGKVVDIAAGSRHTCALLEGGKLRCWGYGAHGRLGYGNTDSIGDNETPASLGEEADVDVGGTVVAIAAGGDHTCALLEHGNMRCWGYGENGQLGYGNKENIGDNENETPASLENPDVDVGGKVVAIAAGHYHTCVLFEDGKLRCWGWGTHGQLGYGNTDSIGDNETPASLENPDVNVGGTVVVIAAGHNHTCALLEGGKVRCWGYGAHGRLGYGNTDNIGDEKVPADAGDVPLY